VCGKAKLSSLSRLTEEEELNFNLITEKFSHQKYHLATKSMEVLLHSLVKARIGEGEKEENEEKK